MAELRASMRRLSAAYEPGWGDRGERLVRRAILVVGLVLVVAQFL